MISGPRNISTALMYSFANRGDFTVVDEPLYGYYLHSTNVDHPGKNEVLETMELNSQVVLDSLGGKNYKTPYAFIKNMGHHLINLDLEFLLPFSNFFLIRDTSQIITSLSKIIEKPTLRDIGIKKEWEAFEYIKNQGLEPIVLDSGLVLQNPEKVLKKLCSKLNIPFTDKMLSWKAGPIKEDGIWAKYWYKNVHLTTGFKKQKSSFDPLPTSLKAVQEEANYYYQKLLAHAIQA